MFSPVRQSADYDKQITLECLDSDGHALCLKRLGSSIDFGYPTSQSFIESTNLWLSQNPRLDPCDLHKASGAYRVNRQTARSE